MALKTFPNGLRLGIQETENERLACVTIHIVGGSQSETNYQSGVGEFLSRMLTMGTKNYPSKEKLHKRFMRDGIIFESDCKAENLLLTCVCQNDKIDSAISLLSEVVFESNFSEEDANIVRNEQLGDILALHDSPSYLLTKLTNNTMFSRTGLANPRFGTVTTIERMTALDAKEYLNKLLTPKNTVISVAGNVESDEVYDAVMKKFYTLFIQESDYKKLKYVAHVDNIEQNIITRNKKLNQSRMLLSFPCLDCRHIKRHALTIALPIILNGLQKELSDLKFFHNEKIEEKRFAANGRLSFELVVDGEHTQEYLTKVVSYLKNKVSNFTEETFELEKNIYITKLLEKYDNVRNLAVKEASEIALNKQTFSLGSELLNVSMMSDEDAKEILAQTLNMKSATICYLGLPIDDTIISKIINE